MSIKGRNMKQTHYELSIFGFFDFRLIFVKFTIQNKMVNFQIKLENQLLLVKISQYQKELNNSGYRNDHRLTNSSRCNLRYSFILFKLYKVTHDQIDLLEIAIPEIYAQAPQNNERTRRIVEQMLNIRKNQLQRNKKRESSKITLLILVASCFIVFNLILSCFKSTNLAITAGGRIETAEPQKWDIICGLVGFIIASFIACFYYSKFIKEETVVN